MKRNEIVTELYHQHTVEKIANYYFKANRLKYNDLEDFVQEIYSIILEMPEEKLNTLYSLKQLEFYVVTIAKNQATNPNSTFNKMYNNQREINMLDIRNNEDYEDSEED